MSLRTVLAVLFVVGSLAVSADGHAVVYTGNPDLSLWVDDAAGRFYQGHVHLDRISMIGCTGQTNQDVVVNADIDPVLGYSHGVPAGNWCSVVFHWASTMRLDGVQSQTNFGLDYSQSTTTVQLGTTISPVALTPWSLAYGNVVYTGNPDLSIAIQ